jgi:hypothetical protein
MKHTGMILFIIGCGGLAESYGNTKATIISLTLAIVGGLIVFHEVTHEKVHIDNRTGSNNILDRLHFLPR